MGKGRLRWAPPHGLGRAVLLAFSGPFVVTLLAPVERPRPVTFVALLYVLAVVVAAALGGAAAGVGASILSFLALNFFFTPPLHTFTVGSLADLVALVVFLVVSVVVGLLLSTALSARSRSEQRELEARLLNELVTRLLSGETTERVLGHFADQFVKTFGFARCEIATNFTDPVVAERQGELGSGEPYEIAIEARDHAIGTMRVVPRAGGELDEGERDLVHVFAGQLALALESMRLSVEVKRAELDAEASRLRATLLSGVTHDLKTPLAAITASVTSLLDGSGFTDEQRAEHLDTIRSEAERLNRVVNNLMDLSRLRVGALVPSKVTGSIEEVIESVVSRLRPLLDGRPVQLQLREELPEISMDVVQMDQVLTNLIENAAKFSPHGTPVSISAVGHPGGVRVTVADRGLGIPKEDRERVFEPFETGHRQGVGTGLGLAIAKAVVVAHGGRMWAQDAPGGGAAITFELPSQQGIPAQDLAVGGSARTGRR
jgi:two-component system sensor histidine kinase KdpD